MIKIGNTNIISWKLSKKKTILFAINDSIYIDKFLSIPISDKQNLSNLEIIEKLISKLKYAYYWHNNINRVNVPDIAYDPTVKNILLYTSVEELINHFEFLNNCKDSKFIKESILIRIKS